MLDGIPGLSSLQSIEVLKSLANPTGVEVPKAEIAGLIAGGLLGWWISNKHPKLVSKYIGVIVGAELGILLVRSVKSRGVT